MAKNAPTCRTYTAEDVLASHQNVFKSVLFCFLSITQLDNILESC